MQPSNEHGVMLNIGKYRIGDMVVSKLRALIWGTSNIDLIIFPSVYPGYLLAKNTPKTLLIPKPGDPKP